MSDVNHVVRLRKKRRNARQHCLERSMCRGKHRKHWPHEVTKGKFTRRQLRRRRRASNDIELTRGTIQSLDGFQMKARHRNWIQSSSFFGDLLGWLLNAFLCVFLLPHRRRSSLCIPATYSDDHQAFFFENLPLLFASFFATHTFVAVQHRKLYVLISSSYTHPETRFVWNATQHVSTWNRCLRGGVEKKKTILSRKLYFLCALSKVKWIAWLFFLLYQVDLEAKKPEASLLWTCWLFLSLIEKQKATVREVFLVASLSKMGIEGLTLGILMITSHEMRVDEEEEKLSKILIRVSVVNSDRIWIDWNFSWLSILIGS